MRSAVRNAAIWALVDAPDMIASIAAAASIRVRSRRSTTARTASVMIGLVIARNPTHVAGATLPHVPTRTGAPDRLRRLQSQVRLLDGGAREELGARAAQHDAPVLEDVAAVREPQRPAHVLLDEQDGRPRRALIARGSRRSSVTMTGARPRLGSSRSRRRGRAMSAAADRAHLLLAARERTGELAAALAEPREERHTAPGSRRAARGSPRCGRPARDSRARSWWGRAGGPPARGRCRGRRSPPRSARRRRAVELDASHGAAAGARRSRAGSWSFPRRWRRSGRRPRPAALQRHVADGDESP